MPVFFYRGKGCPNCNYTGYKGRVAIHEIFIMTDAMRRLLTQNAPVKEIYNIAKEEGFKTMRYDGVKKVLRGLTTMDEVNRMAFEGEA